MFLESQPKTVCLATVPNYSAGCINVYQYIPVIPNTPHHRSTFCSCISYSFCDCNCGPTMRPRKWTSDHSRRFKMPWKVLDWWFQIDSIPYWWSKVPTALPCQGEGPTKQQIYVRVCVCVCVCVRVCVCKCIGRDPKKILKPKGTEGTKEGRKEGGPKGMPMPPSPSTSTPAMLNLMLTPPTSAGPAPVLAEFGAQVLLCFALLPLLLLPFTLLGPAPYFCYVASSAP